MLSAQARFSAAPEGALAQLMLVRGGGSMAAGLREWNASATAITGGVALAGGWSISMSLAGSIAGGQVTAQSGVQQPIFS